MFSTISNYYERLVFDRLQTLLRDADGKVDPDYMDDVACVALNRLPPRYVRHTVDLAFHMTDSEWEELLRQVDLIVVEAIEFTQRRTGERPTSGEYD
jgi:competence protein ComFB